MKKMAKKTLYTQDDKVSSDIVLIWLSPHEIYDANTQLQRILRENAITSKTSLVDDIQRIGHRLRKSSKKLRGLELLLDLMCVLKIELIVVKRIQQKFHQ